MPLTSQWITLDFCRVYKHIVHDDRMLPEDTNTENFHRIYIMDDKNFLLSKVTIFILKV